MPVSPPTPAEGVPAPTAAPGRSEPSTTWPEPAAPAPHGHPPGPQTADPWAPVGPAWRPPLPPGTPLGTPLGTPPGTPPGSPLGPPRLPAGRRAPVWLVALAAVLGVVAGAAGAFVVTAALVTGPRAGGAEKVASAPEATVGGVLPPE